MQDVHKHVKLNDAMMANSKSVWMEVSEQGLHFSQYSSHNRVSGGVFIKEMTDHNIILIGLNRNATTILQITP